MIEALQEMTARFRLRELPEANGIKQTDVAKQADLSFATVNRLRTNATSQVSLETMDKIVSALRAARAKNAAGDEVGVEDVIAVDRESKQG